MCLGLHTASSITCTGTATVYWKQQEKIKNCLPKPPLHTRITSNVCWQFIACLCHKVVTQVQEYKFKRSMFIFVTFRNYKTVAH